MVCDIIYHTMLNNYKTTIKRRVSMAIKVSVIIPIYNCDKYIGQCVETLINQTLKECEFIFINDGSIDNSLSILKGFEKKDSRVKVINQTNQGVSVARNVGLNIATGEYIGFVDGDDYVEKDYFKRLYECAKENSCDIVFVDWKSKQEGYESILNLSFQKEVLLNKTYIEREMYPFFLKEDSLNSVCNKIFKRKLIIDNNISFPKGVALGEDAAFNIKVFTVANNCYYIDFAGYNYREVEGSATRDIISKDYFKSTLSVYKETHEEFEKWSLSDEEIKRLKSIKFINNVMAYTYVYFKPNEKNKLRDRFRYIRQMINTEEVGQAIKTCKDDVLIGKGRYEKTLLHMVEKKYVLGIYLITTYSRIRNS